MYNLKEIEKYIIRDKPEGLIVDTNLLILFLIGKYDAEFIERCALTCNNNYLKEDYELLYKIMKLFKKIIITPYIIAEISNLSKSKIKDEKLINYFKVFVEFLGAPSIEEKNVGMEKFLGIEIGYMGKFGFTDMAICELSKSNNLAIITDDGPFYYFFNTKIPVIKFEVIKNSSLSCIIQ
jgi:hypothetical protein